MSRTTDDGSRRTDALHADEALSTLADVQVAHEELRVAEEELRAQQEQIEHLLTRYESERRWRSQLSGLVPVALCTTDGAGALVDVNSALAAHVQVPPQRLRGKPLSLYLDPADSTAFRSAVRALSTGTATEQRLRVRVRGRRDSHTPADLFGFTDTAAGQTAQTRLQWVLVPVQDPAAGSRAGGSTPELTATESLGLAAALSELSTLSIGDDDRQRLLGRMAVLVRSAVPAADSVSITVGSPLDPQQLSSDSATAQAFDGLQMQAAEGPCWDAHLTGTVVLCPDVTTDERWPTLARLAPGDVRSVVALPLREGEQPVGVVNVYSSAAGAFGPDSCRIAELVAAAVGGVLQSVAEREALRDLAANLEKALTSRAVIDQAKGVLMARFGVDADDAFARLVTLSNRLNVKLRDLAHLVVEGHAGEVIAALER
ncbi:ANTAR domain-containing protein [Geodermatophilus sp. SYSU D01105]